MPSSIHNCNAFAFGRNLSCVDFTVKPFRQAVPYLLNAVATDSPSPDLRLLREGSIRDTEENLIVQNGNRKRILHFKSFRDYLPGVSAIATYAQPDGCSGGHNIRQGGMRAYLVHIEHDWDSRLPGVSLVQ
jgi:hypothetical protein